MSSSGSASLREWIRDRRRRRLSRGGSLSKWRAQVSLLSSLVLLALSVVWSFAYLAPAPTGQEISLDVLNALIGQRRVATAEFHDEDAQIVGTYVAEPVISAPVEAEPDPAATEPAEGEQPDVVVVEPQPQEDPLRDVLLERAPEGEGLFWVAYPASDATTSDLIETLAASGATVNVDAQPGKAVVRLLLTVLLPLMILANLFALFLTWSRTGQAGLGELQDFGSVGDKRVKKGGRSAGPAVGFTDVAGIDDVVVELKEVVDYLANPERYEELGAAPPKGVLLFGPPGVGKTLLAKAVAGEAGVPFFSVAGAEFVESLVGIGAARVRDLFRRVRAVAPAIVFIDELDAAGRKRGASGSGGSDEREQTLNQLLVEMDGFDVESGIVVIAATNRPDILDPALLRPGRFDRHITIEKPDVQARQAILELHAAKRKRVSTQVDFAWIARRTPGFSGADLANVVNEAALLTIRQGKREIGEAEFNEAIVRVISGPKRRGHLMSEEERQRIAVHEAGHAMLASLLGKAGDVHRISIVSHGKGVGATALQADEDRVVLSEGQLRAQLVITLGGAAAEDLVFGEPSTGAEDDLDRVTELAREMVGKYGMSNLGKLRMLASDSDRYLGIGDVVADLSGSLHESFDLEVGATIEHALSIARQVLEMHLDELQLLIDALLDAETLEGPALQPLLPPAASNGSSIDLSRRPTAGASAAPAPKRVTKKSTARKTSTKSSA